MGKVVFDSAATLNGWIADEHNSLEWLFAVDATDPAVDSLIPTAQAVMVEGSTTYQWVLDHEALLDNPQKWAQLYGEKPTFVFTTRELPVPAGADVRFVAGPVTDAMPAIRTAAAGGDIWVVGGGDLAGQFLDAGILDEIRLSVAPVALRGGAPLLPRDVGADRLRLVSAQAHGQFARLIYAVNAPDGSDSSASNTVAR